MVHWEQVPEAQDVLVIVVEPPGKRSRTVEVSAGSVATIAVEAWTTKLTTFPLHAWLEGDGAGEPPEKVTVTMEPAVMVHLNGRVTVLATCAKETEMSIQFELVTVKGEVVAPPPQLPRFSEPTPKPLPLPLLWGKMRL